jgi:hypothetical protein
MLIFNCKIFKIMCLKKVIFINIIKIVYFVLNNCFKICFY